MCDENMQMAIGIVVTIFEAIKFAIPIVLIILCTIDVFKIIVSKKEDEVKKLRKDVVMKVVYAILIYLIPFLIPFVLNLVNGMVPMDYDNTWKECWDFVVESKKNE